VIESKQVRQSLQRVCNKAEMANELLLKTQVIETKEFKLSD
jgi:hypothetical protein